MNANGNGRGNRNGNGSHESLQATVEGAVARCLVRALVVGFDACDDGGMPLSQLQRIALLECALLEFDGLGLHIASLTAVAELLSRLDDD
jgi:hypothetical protein